MQSGVATAPHRSPPEDPATAAPDYPTPADYAGIFVAEPFSEYILDDYAAGTGIDLSVARGVIAEPR
ncbi:hypothetical protein OHT61_18450 [Streptomyces sp. NBC_00178]|uniref:hypothetical protein n=1 Tax=Streptomyces sp. NBC_00178 TaxID=2975672 RepID=UPI002E2A5020|nr:hypothetical protein [Streptomyces sp. NBC_00178]